MTLIQIDVYLEIAKYIRDFGKSPTYGDLAKIMKKKRGTLFGIIKVLEKNGYLEIDRHTKGGFKLVGDFVYDEHIFYCENDIK